jgi:predicted MPP superfamily phosphohydrolase
LTKPCIFLAHQPGDIRDAYRYGIPLTVCGHTHGGQAFPANLIVHLQYPNSYGLKGNGESYSYTTSGLGLSGFPLRVASNSEVVVFDIEIY